ncbi:hypothetical protein JCM10020v2_005894 [Rhodotorula toruloides]
MPSSCRVQDQFVKKERTQSQAGLGRPRASRFATTASSADRRRRPPEVRPRQQGVRFGKRSNAIIRYAFGSR